MAKSELGGVRRMNRRLFAVAVLLLVTFVPASALGAPASAPDCPVFPADNVWHAGVSALPVHSRSADWISSMGGPDRLLHPDFGPSGEEMPYGIPYDVVDGEHHRVQVTFDGPDGGYPEESDPDPYPFSRDTKIEGGRDSSGDRHAIMLDRDNCVLYELYHADWNGGDPTADQGSVFDLRSNDLRPAGWTSADAAGLPIFAGLLRPDEVAASEVDHAIRVTARQTDRSYLWPARHQAGARSDPTLPPMGARFRLKAGFDISNFRSDTQVVLRAMQEHGLILADNGSDWFFGGTAEDGWDNDMLDELKSVPAGQFEAIDASSLMADPDSGRVAGATPPPNTAPMITNTRPAPDSQTRDRTPTIKARIRDGQTDLSKTSITLFIDGERKTSFAYDPAADRLSYTPSKKLEARPHTVKVVVTDPQGLDTTREWSFIVTRR